MLFGMLSKPSADRYGPVIKSSDAGFVEWMNGYGRTESGSPMNSYLAMNLPPVYSAVGIIADNLAQLPIDVYQKNADGTRSKVVDHPIEHLLNCEPNPYMVGFTLRQTLMGHVLTAGNGYQEIERTVGGDIANIFPLSPDATRPVKTTAQEELYYTTTINGKSLKVAKENIIHVPALGYDGLIGYSPITIFRETLGLTSALQKYASKFFANDAKSGGILSHPGKLTDFAKGNISDSFQKQGGPDNAHKVKVLEEGMKWFQTTISQEDSQFLGSREFQVADIARMYRVPLFMMASMEKTSSWGSGIEQMMLAFVSQTLMPWIVKQEQEYARKLFTQDEKDSGLFLKFNVNALLRGDMAARAAFYTAAVGRPWMAANEARSLEDMNPKDGLDEVVLPMNMNGNSGDSAGSNTGANGNDNNQQDAIPLDPNYNDPSQGENT